MSATHGMFRYHVPNLNDRRLSCAQLIDKAACIRRKAMHEVESEKAKISPKNEKIYAAGLNWLKLDLEHVLLLVLARNDASIVCVPSNMQLLDN